MSIDQLLKRSVDALAVRFPCVARETITRCVHESYEQLAAQATVTGHLVPLAHRAAAERLAALTADQR